MKVINALDDLNINIEVNYLSNAESFRMEVKAVYLDILLLFH